MRYPRELIEEIRMHNDIVEIVSQYVPLKQKGSSYFGLCPFHHEKTPSFSVNSEKQFYYCFGCGASGNVYGFLMEMEHCDFPEAVKVLAERANIPLPQPQMTGQALALEKQRSRLFQMHKEAGRFYYDILQSKEGEAARAYLERRQLHPNIARKFGIGYAPERRHALYDFLREKGYSTEDILHSGLVLADKDAGGYHDRFRGRVMFPIFDAQGRVVGFGGRILGKGEPKYLNSPETVLFSKSRNLYGLNFAKAARKKELILVEGYMDMISIYQAGFPNVVASLGTAFNREHAMTLKKYAQDVILLYDSDEAGTNAALRAIPVLVGSGFRVRVTQVPDGKDPDEFIKQNGAVEFSKLLVNAVHYISFQIACIRRNYRLDLPEHRVRFTTEAAQTLAKLDSEIEREVYIAEVSRMTGVEESAIQSEIRKLRRREEEMFRQEAERRQVQRKRLYDGGKKEEKGLLDAQKSLVYYSACHRHVYDVLRETLKQEDFPTAVYAQAFHAVGEVWETAGNVFPAELISFFEDSEAQRAITEVFAAQPPEEEGVDLEKAVNESVKIIKRASIDRQTAQVTTIEEIQHLVEEKRKLDMLHITI